MKKGDSIGFPRKEDYVFIDSIGQGGTGKTILIRDEIIDEVFVCKKYEPYYKEHQELYFQYFVDEIKFLHTTYHKNIVRVFNYYLYPKFKTGYILMEYVQGKNIDQYLQENPDKIEDVFVQVIEGFRYLEENRILHRDLRPENVLISNYGTVKIIDFGFGKNSESAKADKSISLNWRYTIPNEFTNNIYDKKSEIYFVGKMFQEILESIKNVKFKWNHLLTQMTLEYESRTDSFFTIFREIINTNQYQTEFTNADIEVYRDFAESLTKVISKIGYDAKYASDTDEILRRLHELYKRSSLESVLINNDKIIEIFIDGYYRFFSKKPFPVQILLSMVNLLQSLTDDKTKVILNHLWERFDRIDRHGDDLPF